MRYALGVWQNLVAQEFHYLAVDSLIGLNLLQATIDFDNTATERNINFCDFYIMLQGRQVPCIPVKFHFNFGGVFFW